MYNSENQDIDEIDKTLDSFALEQERCKLIEITTAEAYNSGYQAAIAHCRDIIASKSNETTLYTRDIARSAYYELCKELDVNSYDILHGENLSVDDMACRLAKRIQSIFTASGDDVQAQEDETAETTQDVPFAAINEISKAKDIRLEDIGL